MEDPALCFRKETENTGFFIAIIRPYLQEGSEGLPRAFRGGSEGLPRGFRGPSEGVDLIEPSLNPHRTLTEPSPNPL